MNTKKGYSQDVLLGLFVLLGLVLAFLAVFFIGKEKRLFDRRVTIETTFSNVAGLAIGADVLLSGVVIGSVNKINFPNIELMQSNSKDVTVILDISKKSIKWIREDSIARIDSKGLLGDKIVNITIGSYESPQILPEGRVKSLPSVDFNKALLKAQDILDNVSETVTDVRDVLVVLMIDSKSKIHISISIYDNINHILLIKRDFFSYINLTLISILMLVLVLRRVE